MPSPAQRAPLAAARIFLQTALSAAVSLTALLLLWWNESDAVATNRSFLDAPSEVVSLERPVSEPVNEGRLVHATGHVTARVAPQDTDLDLVFDGALAVQRVVEAWQWTETSNGVSWKYVQAWAPDNVDSTRFRAPSGHVNPPLPLASQTLVAGDAALGDFELSPESLSTLRATTPVAPPATPRGWIREGNTLFLGLNPKRPSLGDIRVSWRMVSLKEPVTIIAREGTDAFNPYTLRNGTEILMIREGLHSAADMLSFVDTLASPAFWVVRVLAFIAMAIGFLCTMQLALRLPGQATPLFNMSPKTSAATAVVAAGALCACCMALAWMFRLPFESASVLVACSAGLVTAIRFRHLLRLPQAPQAPAAITG